jgi:hypothetical protein
MDVRFVQSSDPYHYYEIVLETGRTVRRFAKQNGFQYECYIGIKRGYFAWHATFNRILIFKELLDRGFDGWICYLDADAFIVNQNFDLKKYLSDKAEYGAILTSGGSDYFWDVNAGVMFLNAKSPWASWCVREWLARFMTISDEELKSSCFFDTTVPHDQDLLQEILRVNPTSRHSIFLETPKLLNCGVEDLDGAFIAQYMRDCAPNLNDRVEDIKRIVREILHPGRECLPSGSAPASDLTKSQEVLIASTLYWELLNRNPDPDELRRCHEVLRRYGLEYGLPILLKEILRGGPDAIKRQETLIVSALYHGLLNRSPDQEGLQHNMKFLRQFGLEHGLPVLLREFLDSEEFKTLFGTV